MDWMKIERLAAALDAEIRRALGPEHPSRDKLRKLLAALRRRADE